MGVWSFEAAEITNTKDLESRPIYHTPAIEEFLRFEKSQKRIISGLKGTGKTLFLKLISHHYRRIGGITCIPTSELTERLYSIDYDFSGDKAKTWASHERWKHVWRTVLSVLVLKSVKQEIPTEFLEIFPEGLGLSIGAHLSAAIRSRTVNYPKFQLLFPETLDAAIQGITQPVALFVDNIDEALARHSGYDLYRDSVEPQKQSGAHSYELWLSAQIGFLLAVRELSARNAHLKLFGTVRAEAIRDNPTPTAFNLQAMVLDLRYTPAELRGILETKLHRLQETSRQFFTRPTEKDLIRAFFPFDTIEHESVIDAEGRPYCEEIFDYLRRHTRGRPRELDFIGYGLQMIPPDFRTPEKVRELVRALSHRFFLYARNEAVPVWDPRLDTLLNKIPSNFISRRKAEGIGDKVFGKGTSAKLWGALYANGLCGAVVSAYPSGMVQRFSSHDGVAELSEMDFESSRTWVLHPCVNIATRPRRTRYQPHPRSVAGHAYPFVSEPRAPKKHLHVLIGAGKLGLGLVVPLMLLDNGTNVLIVARASDQWQKLELLDKEALGKCTLQIKYFSKAGHKPNDCRISLRVLSDRQTAWQQELRKSVRRNRCVLLISSAEASLQWAVGLGDSIGISVGPKGLETVTTAIAGTSYKAKVILGYENDEEGMRKADKLLCGKFVPTVVDRICIEREVSENTIVVRAEAYGRITALVLPEKQKLLPPVFSCAVNPEVQAITKAEEFSFVREKKKRLVNSLHAAAAALVLRALMDIGARPGTSNELLLGLIASNMEISTQLVGVKELLILSVLGTLPPNRLTGKELPGLILELNDYGEHALKRIIEEPDSPSRVLKTDMNSLSSKYDRLFADVKTLALEALHNKDIQAALPMTEKEISARLAALNEAFLKLFAKAGGRDS